MTEPEPAWRVREGLMAADLDGDISVFDGTDSALVLNPTASAVWTLLDEPRTLSELVDALAPRYDTTVTAIRRDVALLLTELTDRGVVVRV